MKVIDMVLIAIIAGMLIGVAAHYLVALQHTSVNWRNETPALLLDHDPSRPGEEEANTFDMAPTSCPGS